VWVVTMKSYLLSGIALKITVIMLAVSSSISAMEGEGESAKAEEQSVKEVSIGLPGDVLLVLVRITADTFLMGRGLAEQDSYSNEEPPHAVTISQDFYMGKCEVTKRQWQAVMGTKPWLGRVSVLNDLDSPAVYVSWKDCQSFITALNKYIMQTGQGPANFRLPSEAEWEYACRAGTTTRFYWGDDPSYTMISNYAWWFGNTCEVREHYAHVVGLKLPNAFGLYDMSGNVMEWCEDDLHDSYKGAPRDGEAWVDSCRSGNRIFRGGGWRNYGAFCRSAYRYGCYVSGPYNCVGFRICR
jgi:eukaryotic-like serine/threonine-protein kinase